MTREELEKMFDEEFDLWKIDIYNEQWIAIWYENNNKKVKQFIFETIIPEVLKSMLADNPWFIWNSRIKQQAKKLYKITL